MHSNIITHCCEMEITKEQLSHLMVRTVLLLAINVKQVIVAFAIQIKYTNLPLILLSSWICHS